MKTFVINLDRRTDRMIELQNANVPGEYDAIERFPATDSSEFINEEPNRNLRGHYGCWDSHRRLLKKIRDEGHEFAMVLEDDVRFVEGANEKIISLVMQLPEDWDLLYLGGVNHDVPEKFSENLDRAENIIQTHAYIVRSKFLDTLIETLEGRRYKVDLVFCDALKKGNCFIANPVVAFQRDSFSDITNR